VEERALRSDVGTFAVQTENFFLNKPTIGWDAVQPFVVLHTVWNPDQKGPAYRLTARQNAMEWTINTSASMMDAAGEITWVLPDLSSLPGWSDALAFRSLQSFSWVMTVRRGADLGQLIQAFPTEEAVIRSNGFAGTSQAPPY
jgi:hypothetical protein